jgi:hypothetical protein
VVLELLNDHFFTPQFFYFVFRIPQFAQNIFRVLAYRRRSVPHARAAMTEMNRVAGQANRSEALVRERGYISVDLGLRIILYFFYRLDGSKHEFVFLKDRHPLVARFFNEHLIEDLNEEVMTDRFGALKNTLFEKNWIVSEREPIKRPEHVLEYLARYTHRVAIANSRIQSLEDGKVTFSAKNRKKNRTESITISAVEFIRRFLQHSCPADLSESATMVFWPIATERPT